MHQQPQGESIWGTINTCIKIFSDIYEVFAIDEIGTEHSGIMVWRKTAKKFLSKKAIKIAMQDGNWLYYDERTKDIPIYEVLQHRIKLCKKIESAAQAQIEDIRRDGKLSLTDYFGECDAPIEAYHGELTNMIKVRNGIYFMQNNENMLFAVHEAIADNYMSVVAAQFAHKQGDYLFYDIVTCTIALNELKNVFKEAEILIISKNSLYATLQQKFPLYVAFYNTLVQEKYQIPKVLEPTDLFLQMQLDASGDALYKPDGKQE